jgi:hypothetical protein
MIRARDREYIENRLLAPAVELSDAVGRLRQAGENAAADRLTAAMATLIDECRAVRADLTERRAW